MKSLLVVLYLIIGSFVGLLIQPQQTIYSQTSVNGFVPTQYKASITSLGTYSFKELSIPQLILYTTARAGYSPYEQQKFLSIAKCESTLNPNAKGYAGDFNGLMQIYGGTWKAYKCSGDPFNPIDNLNCAIRIQKDSGWSAWECK